MPEVHKFRNCRPIVPDGNCKHFKQVATNLAQGVGPKLTGKNDTKVFPRMSNLAEQSSRTICSRAQDQVSAPITL